MRTACLMRCLMIDARDCFHHMLFARLFYASDAVYAVRCFLILRYHTLCRLLRLSCRHFLLRATPRYFDACHVAIPA